MKGEGEEDSRIPEDGQARQDDLAPPQGIEEPAHKRLAEAVRRLNEGEELLAEARPNGSWG